MRLRATGRFSVDSVKVFHRIRLSESRPELTGVSVKRYDLRAFLLAPCLKHFSNLTRASRARVFPIRSTERSHFQVVAANEQGKTPRKMSRNRIPFDVTLKQSSNSRHSRRLLTPMSVLPRPKTSTRRLTAPRTRDFRNSDRLPEIAPRRCRSAGYKNSVIPLKRMENEGSSRCGS